MKNPRASKNNPSAITQIPLSFTSKENLRSLTTLFESCDDGLGGDLLHFRRQNTQFNATIRFFGGYGWYFRITDNFLTAQTVETPTEYEKQKT